MTSNTSRQSLPIQLMAKKDDSMDASSIMHTLRHFHLGNPDAVEPLEPLNQDFLPALLNAYRDTSQLRYDYPLYLYPCDTTNNIHSSLAKPLSEFLQECVLQFAPSTTSAIALKDNIPWLERALRNVTRATEAPTLMKPLLVDACTELVQHLNFSGDNLQRLQADIEQLLANVPDDGLILAYKRFPALHLLMHLIRNQVLPQISLFKQEMGQSIHALQNLLNVDDTKRSEASSASALKSNISSNQFFNTDSLSKVIQHSKGSLSLSKQRRQRIEKALHILKDFREKEILVHIIHANNKLDHSWLDNSDCFTNEHHDDPCFRATQVFDREAQRLAEVFAAARIAQLEIDNCYDEAIHDPWFKYFNWESFSKKELILVPSVIVLEGEHRLMDESMVSFSHLLNSGRPVNVFVRVKAHDNPAAKKGEDPFHNYRMELGYLGISHRQAVVTQCSAARHQLLLSQFEMALNATRTRLHLVNIGLREVSENLDLNAWLVSGAALEGRAHPFFSFDPAAGDSIADRMDFSGNPQADKDWPTQAFSFQNKAGEINDVELAFTFADYALLLPNLKHHFALIPLVCDSESLIPIADYLALATDNIDHLVPYIEAVNDNNELRKLAVSRALIHACRDRLNFWHSLQEMAGIRSRYIEEAERRIHAEADAKIAQHITQMKDEFSIELEHAKTDAAAQVMGRLTDILLSMDLSDNRAIPRKTASEKSTPSMPETLIPEDIDAPIKKEVIEEENNTFDDAWIDSPLCTTCNDCTDINSLMFAYNDTNQAYIVDVSAGTYQQMVEAAELCPSNCIHPGQPWDKDEYDLEDLMDRAEPYNSF